MSTSELKQFDGEKWEVFIEQFECYVLGKAKPVPRQKNKFNNNRQSNNVQCFCCGKQNHIKAECSLKRKFCSECGQQGHIYRMCPRKQRQTNVLEVEPENKNENAQQSVKDQFAEVFTPGWGNFKGEVINLKLKAEAKPKCLPVRRVPFALREKIIHAAMEHYRRVKVVNPSVPDITRCSVYCKLSRFSWYWGDIRRAEAEVLVIQNPDFFIIRATKSPCDILSITFLINTSKFKSSTTSAYNNSSSNSPIKNNIAHMHIQHYKGLFSLDKKSYVPLEELPQHCASFGRSNNIFKAQALKRNATAKLILRKNLSKEHSMEL
ncbi:hypothetical protein MSG28_013888 [Choristoneura fumiferana]|uniref:Uncharacterized protein n=1 Tax=Choristoneura fumiferana TaxID=7141 RepID=A0ACC0K9C5_CHOFU|nr:hypothetical protein MSG28_013888 [Choristoneura fumiferana]